MSELLKQLAEELYYGEATAVARLTQEALDSGLSPHEVLADGLIAGMNVARVQPVPARGPRRC